VLTDDKGSYVLIVGADKKIQRRAVHVSGIVPNGVTIAESLGADTQVVKMAGAFLQVGESVKPMRVAGSGA
jgi:hypothetical protein